jgi:thiol-disulfide isomerase/thioredoxin
MKSIIYFIIINAALFQISYAQNLTISGHINLESKTDSIYLAENIGGKYQIIQSCLPAKNGAFNFIGNFSVGYYAIWLNSSNYAQIIINNENVDLIFDNSDLKNSIEIIESNENKTLWTFIRERRKIKSKISQAYMNKTEYEKSSKEFIFYDSIEKALQKSYKDYILLIDSTNSGSFLAESIISDIETSSKEEFFKYVDFTNSKLIRSGVFTKKVADYLQFKTEYTEEGFINAIDKILEYSSVNQEVYEFILMYLLDIFNTVGPDIILNYILEVYVIGDACSDLDFSKVLEQKILAHKKIKIGNKAPSISAFASNGILYNLYDICSFYDLNILYFGSSHCGFCEDAKPKILEILNKESQCDIQVIYFSLDEDVNNWLTSQKNMPDNWLSLSELKGWDSKATGIFQIHKTPSFYLLDKESKIISKPKSVEELISELEFLMQKKDPEKPGL